MDIERAAPAPIDTKSFPLNTMNNNTHPIEFFILALLFLVEGICWVNNDLLGYHTSSTPKTKTTTIIKPHVHPVPDITVKELRSITGIKSSKYRKHDLMMLALAY